MSPEAVHRSPANESQPPLRDRLLAFRADILRRLDEADVLEPGWLNTLAGVAAALVRLAG